MILKKGCQKTREAKGTQEKSQEAEGYGWRWLWCRGRNGRRAAVKAELPEGLSDSAPSLCPAALL